MARVFLIKATAPILKGTLELKLINIKRSGIGRFNEFLWLAVILILATVIRLHLFVGIVGSDDVSIANNALRILSSGPYIPSSHYSARVGLIYPLAVIFKLFGVGEWQFIILPFLSSLGGVWLAFLIGRHYGGPGAGSLAALLLAFFPLDANFSTQLMPDLPLGAAMGLSYYLLLKAESSPSGTVWRPVAAGLAWGLAYLIKVEAFFFSFVVLTMLLSGQISFRTAWLTCLSVAGIVGAEHLIYWTVSGDPMVRLHVATAQKGGKMTHEYSMGQLWVFPKAWFLTPYFFGLHYYLLAIAWPYAAIRRIKDMAPVLVWVAIFLFWLQFGGNPFSKTYHVKSHLLRYCNMLNVPMAVLISLAVRDCYRKISPRLAVAAVTMTILASFLLIPFNQLNSEPQIATKKLLDMVGKQQLFPLYLDRVSKDLADKYLYDASQKGRLHSLQKHNFKTMETKLTSVNDISDGYILINRRFVDFGYDRYRVDKVTPGDYLDKFRIMAKVDNPASQISYWSARFLGWAAGMIPMEGIRQKIQDTAKDMLLDGDAVLLELKN